MTDTRQVLLTATTYTGQVETANIVGNAPATSEIASGIPGALPVVTQLNDVALNFTATNMGEENIPDPRLFKFLADEFKLQEQVVREVYKNLSDLSTTEEQVRKLLQKVLADITTTSDVFDRVWTAYRTYTDSTTNTERLQKDFEKVLLDLVNAPDLLRTDVGKYLADVTALANLSYAVILVTKQLQDQTVGFTDVLSRIVEFNRTFEDSVFMTDDFYGSANIDDDQYAQVFKVVLEWISLPETFAVDVTKPDLEDQTTSLEQAYLHSQIPKTDLVNKSDLQTAHIKPAKVEQVDTSELYSFNIVKPDRTDLADASDQASVAATKPVAPDTALIAEQAYLDTNKIASDQTSNSEQQSFEVDKPDLEDQTTTVEQVAKAVTTPISSESYSVSEQILNKLIGLNINEIDYFLEDYVFDITDYTFKAVHARDQITQVVFGKKFEDLVDATDDFYGTTNVDDDQVATVDKVVNEYISTQEAFARLVSYIRLFTETAEMLEEVKLVVQKKILNQATSIEQVKITARKVNLEDVITQEQKEFFLEKLLEDQTISQEQAYLLLAVIKQDQVLNTDDFSRVFTAIRQFTELTSTAIQVEKVLEKVSSDSATTASFVTQVISKVLQDIAGNAEQLAFDFYAQYSDIVDATDDFYGAANIDDDQIAAIDKVVSDYANIAESVTLVVEFYRTFLETTLVSDQKTLHIVKAVLDTANTTEVVSKVSTIIKSDVVGVQEFAEKLFSTSRTETVYQADLFTQSIEPAKYETVSTAELLNKVVAAQKSELAATTETVAKDSSVVHGITASILETFVSQFEAIRDFTETVQQTDRVNLLFNKPAQETVGLSELQLFNTSKRVLDTATTSETVGKVTTTEFADLVDATDDFYGLANIDDDQYVSFQKSVSDYATNQEVFSTLTTFLRSVNESQYLSERFAAVVNKAISDITNSSDTVILLAGPNKTESVTTSQTISLTLQSYFSQDYVELGYTGETYTY